MLGVCHDEKSLPSSDLARDRSHQNPRRYHFTFQCFSPVGFAWDNPVRLVSTFQQLQCHSSSSRTVVGLDLKKVKKLVTALVHRRMHRVQYSLALVRDVEKRRRLLMTKETWSVPKLQSNNMWVNESPPASLGVQGFNAHSRIILIYWIYTMN